MHIQLTPGAFKEFKKKFNTLANKAKAGEFITFKFDQTEEPLIIEIKKKGK